MCVFAICLKISIRRSSQRIFSYANIKTEMAEILKSVPIPEFFNGRHIFITGVTGFMAKVLLEKLLRSCPEIGFCYVLVRPKKGVQPQERVKQLFDSKLFQKVLQDQPGVISKVLPVSGDILEPDFGMSPEDLQRLCHDVSVIFHLAATVKFDEELNLSVRMNIISIQHLLAVCRRMPCLESLVHVSTAYANCDQKSVAERVYEPPLHPKKLIEAVEWMDREMIGALTSKLIGTRPNTYTYTKAMAESLLVEESRGIPVAIVRPSIVGASWKEPFPGWVDSLNGPAGMLLAIGKGLLRTSHGEVESVADIIPVDMATNAMIAAAWFTATQKPESPKVYNCTTGQINSFTWKMFERLSHRCFLKNPCNTVARIPNGGFEKSRFWRNFRMVFDHFIPAYVMDIFLWISGRRPQFVHFQNRIWRALSCMEYFSTRQWKFHNDNVFMLLSKMSPEDKLTFPFDSRSIDWSQYMENFCLGVKQFLLKEDISDLPKARVNLQRLQRIHIILKVIGFLLVSQLLIRKYAVLQALWNFLSRLAVLLCFRRCGIFSRG